MRTVRKAIFWVHLAAGILAGVVILILGVTGVVMSFERQILEANTGVVVNKPAGEVSLKGPEELLAKHEGAQPAATAVIFNSNPEKPAMVQFGRGKSVYVDPYTGESLGEGNKGLKEFFAWNLRLHRWLTLQGDAREVGGSIIAAGNMVFLFLVVSGLYLWFPKRWTRSALKAVTTLQFRLKGKARDWNWHNVFGFWACVPLFLIVVTGAVMSYSWANNLIYQMVGETPPPPRGQGGPPGGGGGARAEGRGEGRGERGGAPRAEGGGAMAAEGGQRGERGGRGEGREGGGRPRGEGGGQRGEAGHSHDHDHGPVSLAGLDAGLAKVKAASNGWQTISVGVPRGEGAQYTVSASHRGRPDLRRTLTVDLAGGEIVKNEGFESQTTGRKIRTFVRWVHTGEALGWFGQLIAGLSALSAVVLVWTGFALSWRRFFKKKRVAVARPAPLKKAA